MDRFLSSLSHRLMADKDELARKCAQLAEMVRVRTRDCSLHFVHTLLHFLSHPPVVCRGQA